MDAKEELRRLADLFTIEELKEIVACLDDNDFPDGIRAVGGAWVRGRTVEPP